MLATDRPCMSEAEFAARPHHLAHAELFDGELIVTPSPSPGHQMTLMRIYNQVFAWASQQPTPWTVLVAPLDTRLAIDRVLQPDLLLFDIALPDDFPLPALPVLTVEVLSPSNHSDDRHAKRLAYGQAGIAEQWVVDPDTRTLERFTGPGLRTCEVHEQGFDARVAPGLRLDAIALWGS